MASPQHLEILMQGVEAWNAWREENPDTHPDLRGADLEGYDLGSANFDDADLRGVSLQRASLVRTDFERTRLYEADFWHADLRGASLLIADLRETDLREADFRGAELWQVNVAGADFRGARFGKTAIIGIDLSPSIGLGEVVHYRSSEIAASTLEASAVGLSKDPTRQGEIGKFLRRAGMLTDYVDFFSSRIGHPIEYNSAFISYSHSDGVFARNLHTHLQDRGINVWLDEHQILPGDDIYEAVDRGIRLWDKVLLCCSEASLTSWWVEDEISKALEKERQLRRQQGKKILAIIPLDLDGYLLEGWRSGKATAIRDRLAADFTGWETDNATFEEQLERVVRALRTGEGGRETPPVPRL